MRVLVTGGCGFIGSHTIEALSDQGHQVLVIDDLSTGKLQNIQTIPDENFLGMIHEDLCDADLDRILYEVDAVIHLAALVSVPESIENPSDSFRRNVESFNRLLSFLKVTKHPLVYASSAAVYGDCGNSLITETFPLQPLSPYGADKATNDLYARTFSKLYDLRSVGLRYFNVYGPRQDPKSMYAGVIAKFIESAKLGYPLLVRGDGTQTRSFINVKDVANYNVMAIEKISEMNSGFWGSFNVGHPETISIVQLAKLIKDLSNSNSVIKNVDELVGEIKHSTPNLLCNQTFFGKQKLIDLERGLTEML